MVATSTMKAKNHKSYINHKCKSNKIKNPIFRNLFNIKKNTYAKTCIISILLVSLLTSYNTYININCKDLSYSIEHNLTKGFSSDKKLYRVQSISIIESKGSTKIIKAFGISKKAPHKNISVIANFKNENGIWVLKHIY